MKSQQNIQLMYTGRPGQIKIKLLCQEVLQILFCHTCIYFLTPFTGMLEIVGSSLVVQ